MKRLFLALALCQSLSAQAENVPSVALVGDLYRGDEKVSSFSMAKVTTEGIPVQIEDRIEHGYVDRATFKNGEIAFVPASVFSGLTLDVAANLTSDDTVILRVKGQVAELNGFALKPVPGSTATVQEPRMHRNGFSNAVVVKKGEQKDMIFGVCAPKDASRDLCTYKLVITVQDASFRHSVEKASHQTSPYTAINGTKNPSNHPAPPHP